MSSNNQYHIKDDKVKAVFDTYPPAIKRKLLALRRLIFTTAEQLESVGELTETLKWGQPSYLTKNPKTGTTIRIDGIKNQPDNYGLYVHCQTDLIARFRQMYSTKFEFSGNRGLIFHREQPLPKKQLCHCIALALTYHLPK